MPRDNKYTFTIIGNDKTQKIFKNIAKQMRGLVNTAGNFATGAAAGLALITERTITAGAEMGRLAESVGISAQSLSEWQYAAKTVNLEGDKMADIFKDVSEKIGEFAAVGTGGATDVFERLNLNVNELVKLAPDQQLIKIGEALDGVATKSEKIAFMEMLAGDASRLLPLLEDNAEGLRNLQQEARDLGLSISDLDAEKLKIAKESMERAQGAVQGLMNKIAIQAAPIVEVLANKFVDVAVAGDGAAGAIEKGFKFAGKVIGVFADGIHGIKILIKGLEVGLRALPIPLLKFGEVAAEIYSFLMDKLLAGLQEVLSFGGKAFKFLGMEDPFAEINASVGNARAGIEEFNQELAGFNNSLIASFGDSAKELNEMLEKELPSKLIAEKIDSMILEADEKSKERLLELRNKLKSQSEDANIESTSGGEQLENERNRLAAQVAMIGEFQNTELLQLQQKLASEQILLEDALSKQAITKDAHDKKMLALEKKFELDKKALKTREFKADVNLTAGFLSSMAQIVGGSQKKIFDIQKKISLAKALVTLPAAVIETYNNNGGFPFGIPAAVAMAAQGLAQIASIKKQSAFGGGSPVSASAGGGGGSSAASSVRTPNLTNVIPASSQTQPQEPIVNNHYIVNGDLVSENAAEWITNKQKEEIENGDLVLISPQSRNGQELAAGVI